MNEPIDTPTIIAVLGVTAIMASMVVGLAFGMDKKQVPVFFGLAFAVLTGIMFREHWAAGTFVAIVGVAGVTALIGVERAYRRDKAKKKADGTEPTP